VAIAGARRRLAKRKQSKKIDQRRDTYVEDSDVDPFGKLCMRRIRNPAITAPAANSPE